MTIKSDLNNRKESLDTMAQMLIAGDVLNFEVLFKELFSKDEQSNRLPQFFYHWSIFANKYSSLIPKKVSRFASNIQLLKNNEIEEISESIEKTNNYLLSVDGDFFLEVENIDFLKKYLNLTVERAHKTKTKIPISQMYQIEIVIYSLLLREELGKKDLMQVLKYLPESSVLKLKTALAEYLDVRLKADQKKSIRQNLEISKPFISSTTDKSLSIDKTIFLELKKSGELNLKEKLDLLLLSENYEEALRLIENADKSDKCNENLLFYITECLFLLKRVAAIKKVIDILPSFLSMKSEKRFYLYLLKKLLIQQKQYSSSRSVEKLIRRI